MCWNTKIQRRGLQGENHIAFMGVEEGSHKYEIAKCIQLETERRKARGNGKRNSEHCTGYDTGTSEDNTRDMAQKKIELAKPLRVITAIFSVFLTPTFYLSHNINRPGTKCW